MSGSSYDDNNIFAKILRGEIPSHRVYEDDAVIAFMDVMPQAEGHTLVVPKAASRNILDADPATLTALIPVVHQDAVAAMAPVNDYLAKVRATADLYREL